MTDPTTGPVHPTVDDPVVGALSEPVGGPVGSRARSRQAGGGSSWWTPLRVLLGLTALSFALGLVAQTSCVAAQWRGDGQFARVCGSEIADSYTGTGLVEGAWPWSGEEETLSRHAVLEEPALVGLWTYAAARATQAVSGGPTLEDRYGVPAATLPRDLDIRRERTIFVAANAIGLAVLALLTTLALSRVHRRRPWDAAGFALAPLLVVTGLTAWDLIAVSAVALALLAWSRRRPVLAGALVGVGVAAGVWPVLLLGAFALAGARAARLVEVPRAVAAAVVAWACLNLPALVSGPAQWQRSWAVAADRGPDSGTLWTVLDESIGISHDTVLTTSWALVGVWVAGVVALCLLAPSPPRASQAALLLVAGFVLLRPAFEPHQALWLLPLAALARPRWRDLLVWQSCAVVFAAMHSWWRGGLLDPGGDGPAGFYWIGIGVHVVGTLWLVATVVGDVWWPELDPVGDERPRPDRARRRGQDGCDQVTTMRSKDVVV
ncbi:MAG: glycosyltransferase 87 family protein [Nocardioides sp.]|uniref:glycosyltransferase 87 family protein n=1 Tax=Nocardioides sp. TaxID=35761 RepID=UPI00239956FA|nr:glycosyltransferase 87 family protein [Nocardioides sp.]MDE0778166.1 glycosyltransferase 87 family protein [Nocardioides sp.]